MYQNIISKLLTFCKAAKEKFFKFKSFLLKWKVRIVKINRENRLFNQSERSCGYLLVGIQENNIKYIFLSLFKIYLGNTHTYVCVLYCQ